MNGRRVAGAVLLLFVVWVGVLASGFRVSFPTDPIGPRAFPLIALALVSLGVLSLWRNEGESARTRASAEWPGPDVIRSALLATASFVAYALLLAPVGFVVATTAEFTALALLFGGPPFRGAVAGLSLALFLYGLFVFGLGLPLPVGMLFS